MHVSKVRFAIATALCAGMLVVNAAGALAAATPSTRVSPSFKLTNAQSITVTWRGYSAKDKFITITECNNAYLTGGSLAHCDTAHATTVTGIRVGSGPFVVHTGTIGDQTCGTTTTDKSNCLIAVRGSDASHVFITGQSATAAIHFA